MPVQKATSLTRGTKSGFTPAKLVQAAFTKGKDVPATAEGATQTERYVFKVTAVEDPKLDPTSPGIKALENSLRNAYSDDIIGQYIAQLEHDYGVSINQTALNQVVGGTAPGS